MLPKCSLSNTNCATTLPLFGLGEKRCFLVCCIPLTSHCPLEVATLRPSTPCPHYCHVQDARAKGLPRCSSGPPITPPASKLRQLFHHISAVDDKRNAPQGAFPFNL